MQFISQLIFASAALAASSFVTTTETETISSCAESVTDCPYKNSTSTVSTFSAGANGAHGSYYAAGAAALAAGALLILTGVLLFLFLA